MVKPSSGSASWQQRTNKLNHKVNSGGQHMSTLLIIILILLLVGALPTWPYSGGWGYYPSGGLGLILLIIIILALMGRL